MEYGIEIKTAYVQSKTMRSDVFGTWTDEKAILVSMKYQKNKHLILA